MNSKLFLFQSLLIILICYHVNFQIISIPFKFDMLSHHNYNIYNSTYFLIDNIKKDIVIDLNIGTPPQKVNGKLDPNSECFLFKINNQSNSNYLKNYFPSNSSSFSKKNGLIIYKPYVYSMDIFHFPQINNNYSLFIFVENYTISKNFSYIPVLGVNIPKNTFGNCPNFIFDLKNGKIINKVIWSLKYNNKFEGEFIIGDELSQYNPTKYIKNQYFKTYLSYQNYINFDSVYIPEKQYLKNYDNSIIKHKFNITNTHLHINSGLIIGTEEYKDYIDKNFFNLLFNKSFCKVDIISYEDNHNKKYTNDYYAYSCYSRHFTGQTSSRFPSTNFYQQFPSLIFSSKSLEYNFELTYENLFELIKDKYYFLVVFKKNKNSNEKEMWDLGEPFYKKYTFSINKDANTIGFYIGKGKIQNQNDTNINDNKNENKIKDKNSKLYKIIKYSIEIIVINILLYIAYYIGVTVRERRKKRANELKDDNYEYFPEKNKNKDINDIKTESKNQQFVELNSKLGL